MKGSKEPLWERNVDHMDSNFDITVAAVRSWLGWLEVGVPGGSSWERDVKGGRHERLRPQPKEEVSPESWDIEMMWDTNDHLNISTSKVCVDEDTPNFPFLPIPNNYV
jgi:hypothetical protein